MTGDKKLFDVSELTRPSFVNENVIKDIERDSDKKAVIVDALGVRELVNKEGDVYHKAFVIVEFSSGHRYEYGFPKPALRRFAEELGTTDIRRWVGAVVKFEMSQIGNFVDAFVFPKPGDEVLK